MTAKTLAELQAEAREQFESRFKSTNGHIEIEPTIEAANRRSPEICAMCRESIDDKTRTKYRRWNQNQKRKTWIIQSTDYFYVCTECEIAHKSFIEGGW